MLYEHGLTELQPFLTSSYLLLDEGRAWQRERSRRQAIVRALSWYALAGQQRQAPTSRRFWNALEVIFETLPPQDGQLLEEIEGIVSLSVPKRSKFRRGVRVYDVGALEADHMRLDGAMLDWESGVKATFGTRDFPEAATWSFGRVHETDHLYTEAEGLALGNWLEPVEDEPLAWTLMEYPWVDATFPWAASAEVQRQALLAGWFLGQTLYLALRDAEGAPIGWRRCRAVRAVAQTYQGGYRFDGVDFDPQAGGGRLYVEAMTQFEDADGVVAAEAAIVVGAGLADGIPPGRQWLEPGELSGGVEFAVTEISVPLRRTVREQFKFLVRF